MLREALRRMGRGDLIGSAPHQLVPAQQPTGPSPARSSASSHRTRRFTTKGVPLR
jgi:hypothetical protein